MRNNGDLALGILLGLLTLAGSAILLYQILKLFA
jgi:hypothetical protein